MKYDTARMRRLGTAFGYPTCCVDWFCDCLDHNVLPSTGLPDGPWRGTGFVPCPPHAAEIARDGMAGMTARIMACRLAPHPFPGHPADDVAYADALESAAE